MMKKYLPLLALACSLDLHACTLSEISSDPKVYSAVKVWDAKNFAEICKKLNNANAAIISDGHATVLAGVSIGWASISVKDKNTMVMTNEYSSKATHVNTSIASMDHAEILLKNALNDALGNLNVDEAIQSLDKARRAARAAYGARDKAR